MNIERISSPEIELSTLRERGYEGTFRPSATGDNVELLYEKLSMEKLEVMASRTVKSGFVACAAHESRDLSICNAKFEAIERLSVASWWALGRPWTRSLSKNITDHLATFINSERFLVRGGYINPVCGTGTLAVVIIRNEEKYPMLILGSCYGIDEQLVASDAFFEAAQSWMASDWLRVNQPQDSPHWDTGHLRERFDELDQLGVLDGSTSLEFDNSKIEEFFHDKSVVTKEFSEGYVTWVYLDQEPAPVHTYELAGISQKPDEIIKVYTQCNF